MRNQQRMGRELTLYAVLFVTACAILGAMLFVLKSGNEMIAKIGPLADATMEIGLDATKGHLWLMEAAIEDDSQRFDSAQFFLERANLLADAMLSGGTVGDITIPRLEDAVMRSQIAEIQFSLKHLMGIHPDSLPALLEEHLHQKGTHSHDQLFENLLEQTGAVEAQLREVIRNEHSYFRKVQLTLIAVCVGFFLLVATVLYRYISDRKRYEARIKRLNLILRAIRNVNHLITREKDRQQLIKSTCELLVEARGLHNAWITLVDESGAPTFQAEAGLGDEFSPALAMLKQGKLLPCCQKSLSHEGVLVIEDPSVECPECPLAAEYTGRSGLAVKLEHNRSIYGYMVVSSPRAYAFDTEEHDLFAELAEDIALSLHLLNVEDERRRAEKALRESEERYRILAANIPNIDIYLFDRNMRYLVAEGTEMRGNGLSSDFYEGRTLSETWDESLCQIMEPLYRKALSGENTTSEFQCCDNAYALTVVPVYDGNREVSGGLALSQNITEQKQSEEALKRSEGLLRHTFEAIPDLISVHDSESNVILSNWHGHEEAYKRYSDGHHKCYQAYMNSDTQCDPCYAQEVFKTGKPVSREVISQVDGRTREVNIYPVLDEQGTVVMVTEHVRDITERKRAEKLQAALFRISEATNLTHNLEELLATIHETLGSLLDTTNFFVALHDAKQDQYTFPYCVDEYDGCDFPAEQLRKSLTDYVRKTGRPLLADEKTHRQLLESGDVELVGQPSLIWLGVPLITSQGVIGVVVVQSYSDPSIYEESDMNVMTFVSGHITMAIERKLAEEALRKSEERLRAIYDQASVGVALIGNDGRWLAVNKRLSDIVGYSRDELLEMSCHDITHRDDNGDQDCIIDQIGNKSKPNCSCEKRYRHKDGSNVWVNVSAAIVHEPDEDEDYLVAVIQDITERKSAENMVASYTEKLVKANRDLEVKQAELEEFIYTVSHDLKAPIVSISGFAGLVKQKLSENIDDASARQLDRIIHNSAVMETLISDLLELSRIGRTDEPPAGIDMDELVDEVLESFVVSAGKKKIRLAKAGSLPNTHGWHQRVRQLLTNLIDNAIKYMPEKSDALVEIGFQQNAEHRDGPRSAYFVRDTGDGIPAEFHERIFGMFQRAQPAIEGAEGTGIGLAIVRRIVQKHGGQVWLKSEIGKGATFYFTLPGSSDDKDLGDINIRLKEELSGTD